MDFTKDEIESYIEDATPYAEELEGFVEKNGIVGLGFLVKILAQNMEDDGTPPEWFIDNLIVELKKEYK